MRRVDRGAAREILKRDLLAWQVQARRWKQVQRISGNTKVSKTSAGSTESLRLALLLEQALGVADLFPALKGIRWWGYAPAGVHLRLLSRGNVRLVSHRQRQNGSQKDGREEQKI